MNRFELLQGDVRRATIQGRPPKRHCHHHHHGKHHHHHHHHEQQDWQGEDRDGDRDDARAMPAVAAAQGLLFRLAAPSVRAQSFVPVVRAKSFGVSTKPAMGLGWGAVSRSPGGSLLHRLSRASDVVYDRANALAYARKFWNLPCSDGVVSTSTGDGAFVVPSGARFVQGGGSPEHLEDSAGNTILTWHDLDDCTHFISCCIGKPPQVGARFDRKGYAVEPAGGLNVPSSQMGFPTYGFVRVSSLVDWLVSKGIAQAVATKTHDPSKLSLIEPGDLIAYWDPDRGRYQHFAMFVGQETIACHTVNRSDDPSCTWGHWNVDGGAKLLWTFLKMP